MRTTKKIYKMIIYLQKLAEDCRDKGFQASDRYLDKALDGAICSLRAVRIRLRDHEDERTHHR